MLYKYRFSRMPHCTFPARHQTLPLWYPQWTMLMRSSPLTHAIIQSILSQSALLFDSQRRHSTVTMNSRTVQKYIALLWVCVWVSYIDFQQLIGLYIKYYIHGINYHTSRLHAGKMTGFKQQSHSFAMNLNVHTCRWILIQSLGQ